MEFAFVSRHQPTDAQHALAAQMGHTLTHIGDCDAFTIDAGYIYDHGTFEGVVVVHPAAALRLAPYFVIGVFENGNRAAPNEPPKFEPKAFRVFGLRGDID